MSLVVYGIANCDSVRRARRWLAGKQLDYRFHDLRADGLDPAMLEAWADAAGWESLLNKRSRTFAGLADADKRVADRDAALALMQANPALVKRPVAAHEDGARVLVGFNESEWENAFC